MKRTTILLPDDLAYLLERERRRRGVSTAAIVREAIAAHFNISSEPRRLGFASLGHSDRPNYGRNLERYLEEEWGPGEFLNRTMGRSEPKSAECHLDSSGSTNSSGVDISSDVQADSAQADVSANGD